ncbi:hypothetical protein MMC07_000396 [Pseudocyphellaria aurata]|nr:hypothetical protein [Pseudocyphellaria aurata]
MASTEAVNEAEVSQEVSALFDLLPEGSDEDWQQVQQGLANLLLQARTESKGLAQKLSECADACRVAAACDLESVAAQQQERIWALQTQQGISAVVSAISAQSSHPSMVHGSSAHTERQQLADQPLIRHNASGAQDLNKQRSHGCLDSSESSTSTIHSSDGASLLKQVDSSNAASLQVAQLLADKQRLRKALVEAEQKLQRASGTSSRLQDQLQAQQAATAQLRLELADSKHQAARCSQAMKQQLAAQAACHQQQVIVDSDRYCCHFHHLCVVLCTPNTATVMVCWNVCIQQCVCQLINAWQCHSALFPTMSNEAQCLYGHVRSSSQRCQQQLNRSYARSSELMQAWLLEQAEYHSQPVYSWLPRVQVQKLQQESEQRRTESLQLHSQLHEAQMSSKLSSKASASNGRELAVLQQHHLRELAHLKAEHDRAVTEQQTEHEEVVAAAEGKHKAEVEEICTGMRGVAAAELAAAQKLHQQAAEHAEGLLSQQHGFAGDNGAGASASGSHFEAEGRA